MRRAATLMMLLWAAASAQGCNSTEEPTSVTPLPITLVGGSAGVDPGTTSCEATDEMWLKRVFPLMLGRRPASVREVAVWLDILKQSSKHEVISALARSPEYRERWSQTLRDFLFVNRAGIRANRGCYGEPMWPEASADLAAHVRDHGPAGDPFGMPWNMSDLMASAFVLDDVSPVFLAHLFAQGATVPVPLDDPFEEQVTRETLADIFQRTYLNRRLACIGCHNSAAAVTDHPDPALDHHWPLEGLAEAPLQDPEGWRPERDLRCMFRVVGVTSLVELPSEYGPMVEFGPGHHPWGGAKACGVYVPEAEIEPDALCDTGFLVADHGDSGSLWDVERSLRAGFDALRKNGLSLWTTGDTKLGSEEALAWLVSMSLAERVWVEATGRRLTNSNYFPRNRAQRDVLEHLATTLVKNHFSLAALLSAVASHPFYNQGAPAQCEAAGSPYYLPPVFEPYATDEEDPELQHNSVGDQVHRHPPRVLLTMVVKALAWTPYPEFFGDATGDVEGEKFGGEAAFERDLGVFLKDTESGFLGTDFQGTLTWEYAYGACVDPNTFAEEENFETRDPTQAADWPNRIIAAAGPDATLEDAVIALKDRLLGDPDMSDESERALLEALVEAPLGQPVAGDMLADARLRRVCAVLLATPQFVLDGISVEDRAHLTTRIVVPGTERSALCAEAALLFEERLTCENGEPTLAPP